VLTAADREQLRRDWAGQYGALPSAAQEEALLEEAIDEEVLHREALALGLHHGDRLVRARLVQLARFLSSNAGQDEETLEREARALGLDRRDLVIRRYLVQTMRLLAAKSSPSDVPTRSDLEAYFNRHSKRFLQPERVHLTHVYLNQDRRGAAIEADAARLLENLRRAARDPETAPSLGDPFVRGPLVRLASRSDLDRIFGPGFADAIDDVEPRVWAGPVRSSYGRHLVWIHERIPAQIPSLDAVRNQVLHRLLRERSEERLRTRLQALRQRYEITVERPHDARTASRQRFVYASQDP
jgi:hypothetical protein